MCSAEYLGGSIVDTAATFEVSDYYSNAVFFEAETVGDLTNSVAQYLDTEKGGTSDWYLSDKAADVAVDCN